MHRASTTTYNGSAALTPEGSLYPELDSLALTDEQVTLEPFAVAGELNRKTLQDRGLAAAAIDTLYRRHFVRQLENQILTGTGGSFSGVLNSSPATVAKGTGSRLAALATGMATVMDAGFGYDGGLVAVANPDTLKAVLSSETSASQPIDIGPVLPFISAWIPSVYVPAGDVLIGDWFQGGALFLNGDLELQLSNEHADLFVRGMTALRLVQTYAAFRTTRAR